MPSDSIHRAGDLPCRILLVDDHPITRQGMRTLLERDPGFLVCAETDNAIDAVAALRNAKPNLAIVDISLRGENGLELVKEITTQAEQIPVLVVSMHDEEFYASRAQRAGAAGYVMKQHASDRILAALRRIVAGQTAFADPEKRRTWSESLLVRSRGAQLERLSAREAEVLRQIGAGYATREIAEKLGLSMKTIDTYREHLKLKLDLASAEELVQFAVGWLNSELRSENR
jgi:DNA-binding NarL/FixJ family response regulator